jgi:hypothetical protein
LQIPDKTISFVKHEPEEEKQTGNKGKQVFRQGSGLIASGAKNYGDFLDAITSVTVDRSWGVGRLRLGNRGSSFISYSPSRPIGVYLIRPMSIRATTSEHTEVASSQSEVSGFVTANDKELRKHHNPEPLVQSAT